MTGQIIIKTLSLLPFWRGLQYKLPPVIMVASGHPQPGTKKTDPPVFSGNRREWPDFTANWEYYSLANLFERASALRSSVKCKAYHFRQTCVIRCSQHIR